MKAKWIALALPALLVVGLAGSAEAGGGYGYGKSHYGYGPIGHRGFGHVYRHRGPGYRGYRHAYGHGYRRGYKHGFRPGYRGYRRGYHKGYRHGYRHGHRRSYYPDAYRYDPLLGVVRGIYHPYARGGISLHFGY